MPLSKSWLAIGGVAVLAASVLGAYINSARNRQPEVLTFGPEPAAIAGRLTGSEAERLAPIGGAFDGILVQIAQERRDLLADLAQRAPQACADYYYGDFPLNEIERLPAGSAGIALRHRTAILAAAESGRTKPVTRAPFDNVLNERLGKAIETTGGTARQRALAAGAPPNSVAEACDSGLLIYKAVASLPADQTAAWMAQALTMAVRHRTSVEQSLLAPDSLAGPFAIELKQVSPSHFERLVDAYVLKENGAPEAAAKAAERLEPEIRDRLKNAPPKFREIWLTAERPDSGQSSAARL